MVDPGHGFDEAQRRHQEMLTEWASKGHPRSACFGHTYPLPGCPAPQVHREVFPPKDGLTMDRVLSALRAVFEDMDSTGRAGDEWAYEWIHEAWPRLVPLVVRKAVGDRNALEEP